MRSSRRSRAITAWVFVVLGAALIAAVVVIGVHIDWMIAGPIATRRSEVWAWIPMTLMTAAGIGLTAFGIRLVRSLPRRGSEDSTGD